jgi:hypothetical protein
MTLKFSDGMEFKTDSELHVERRRDGWYVVGNGMLIPANDYEEAKEILEEMKK